jgi:hypothetical protein
VADGRTNTDSNISGSPDVKLAPDQSVLRTNLRHRLERIPDGHPSSADYRSADLPPRHTDRQRARDPAASESGRRGPDAHEHPDLPSADSIKLADDRARHILDGDGPGTPGGGHRHGTGRPGKTEFPETWPDDKVLAAIEDAAGHPADADWQEFNSRWRVSGEREHVRVTVVVLPDGSIWAAWPEPGGAGVTQNPRT